MLLALLLLALPVEAQGLKKVNYENAPAPAEESALTPEQAKKLKEDVEIIKAKQIEAEKVLKEIDEEEE